MTSPQLPDPNPALPASEPQLLGPPEPGGPLVQVVEDDATLRETVAAMLAERGFRAELFASAEEFLASPPAQPPACLLIDNKLPGISGLELQKRLLTSPNPLPIVVISGHVDVQETVQFLRQGATTLLPKPFHSNELISAITKAIESGKIRAMMQKRYAEISASVEQLSEREKTVLQAIVAGQLNKAIARSLDVSVRTVEGDRAKIVDKFDAETTGEVVGKFAQYSLLTEMGGPGAVDRLP